MEDNDGGHLPDSVEEKQSDTTCGGNLPVPEVPGEPANDNIDMSTEPGDNTSDSPQAKSSLRCSQRHREQPKRFQYHLVGDPLIYIVHSLFQSLSNACAEASRESRGSKSFPSSKLHVV